MTEWIRFSRDTQFGFGVIEDEKVISYKGDMFHAHESDGEIISFSDLTLECPVPSSALNDVTAVKIIREEKGYEQWCRAKGFDTFGPCEPTIRTEFVSVDKTIRAVVNGEERQNYAVRDMISSPSALVSFLSRCQTLRPGDVTACGTSLDARSMKNGDEVEIVIEGLAVLKNMFQSPS